AGLIGADRQESYVDGNEPPSEFGESVEVAGVPGEVVAPLPGIEEPRAPEGGVSPHAEPVGPVLGRQAGQGPTTVVGALPPVQLGDLLSSLAAEPVAKPQGNEPGDRFRQAAYRPGVQMVVVVVGEDDEGVRWDGAER